MTSHSLFYYLDHYFWLGITDVVNGEWRWIYDQTTPKYKFWHPGQPHPASNANSKDRNCGLMLYSHAGKWHDYPCSNPLSYICESNFCKFIILLCRWHNANVDLKNTMGKNTIRLEQFQNPIEISQKEPQYIYLTHKYMTTHSPRNRHFNKK